MRLKDKTKILNSNKLKFMIDAKYLMLKQKIYSLIDANNCFYASV